MSAERGHILLADDDAMVLNSMASALTRSGFEVTAVESGADVLAALREREPDALLLDINMPGNQDLELADIVSRGERQIPIVLLTGHPAMDTAMRAVRLGVVDYLFKPQELSHLIERLDLAVQRSRMLRSVSQAERAASQLSERLHTLKQAIRHTSSVSLALPAQAPAPGAPSDPLRNLAPRDLALLSAREREVLRELARGHTPQRIAASLGLSTNTVRNHLKSIFLKLRVNSQIALLAKLATPQQ